MWQNVFTQSISHNLCLCLDVVHPTPPPPPSLWGKYKAYTIRDNANNHKIHYIAQSLFTKWTLLHFCCCLLMRWETVKTVMRPSHNHHHLIKGHQKSLQVIKVFQRHTKFSSMQIFRVSQMSQTKISLKYLTKMSHQKVPSKCLIICLIKL